MTKVRKIIGVACKKDGTEIRGEKNGNKWAMMHVVLDDDIEAKVFAPVTIGDEIIELVQDPKYHTWKGKVKKTKSDSVLPEILEELKKVNQNLVGSKS